MSTVQPPPANRRRKRLMIGGLLTFLLYVGSQCYQRVQDAHALLQETHERAIMNVAVTRATTPDPVESITLPGNVEAWYQAPIYAQVSGYVKMWYKDYGAEVKQGDILAEINTPTLDAEYEQAKADMEAQRARYGLAKLTAKRYQALEPAHAVSVQSISVKTADARAEAAQLRAAQNNVRNFEARLRFKIIVAPYDGVLISRTINVGDYVTKEGNISNGKAGDYLFTVADVHKMRLFVSVPESFGPFLKPGLQADVVLPQFPDRHYTAQFLTVARGFDPSTRTAVTEFTIDNQDRSLWPGSYATVRLSATLNRPQLIIPTTTLVFQEAGTQVATVDKHQRVHFKKIQVGKLREGTIDVISGITKEDQIIDHPSAALLEGDRVRVVHPAPGYKRNDSK